MKKLDNRLPESQAIRVLQLLDPSTKDGLPRNNAIKLLEDTVTNLSRKNLINLQTSASHAAISVETSPQSKRRRLKQEMLSEMCCSLLEPSEQELSSVALEITNYLAVHHDAVDDVLEF